MICAYGRTCRILTCGGREESTGGEPGTRAFQWRVFEKKQVGRWRMWKSRKSKKQFTKPLGKGMHLIAGARQTLHPSFFSGTEGQPLKGDVRRFNTNHAPAGVALLGIAQQPCQ